MGALVQTIAQRWKAGWRDALASAVAAGLSWLLAHRLFGHPPPVFAAVAAIVCLAPGLPSRGRQAVHMMLGVTIGIVVGEALLSLPCIAPALRMAALALAAMMAALSFGLAPVIVIQAGVSAMLVVALGPVTAGPVRLMDAAVGAAVALLFSQVLLTPDPVRQIDDAAHRMLRLLAKGFEQEADALTARNVGKAKAMSRRFIAARESLIALGAGIELARSNARWSLRGRLAADEVAERAARYDRRAIHLFAAVLLFAEALADALRNGEEPPPWLRERVKGVAKTCATLATGAPAPPRPSMPESRPQGWRLCLAQLKAVEDALDTLGRTSDGAEASAPATASSPDRRETEAVHSR